MNQSASSAPEHGNVALIVFLGLVHAMGPWSIDLFVPSLPLAADGMGVGYGDIQLTTTAVLLGIAAGQAFYGPLSDRFGRRSMLVVGLIIFSLASYLSASAETLGELAFGRAIQGFGGASGIVLVRAIVLDRWVAEEASRVLSAVTILAFLAPVLAPLTGGYVTTLGDWTLVFWLHGVLGAIFLLGALTLLSSAYGGRPEVSVASRFIAYSEVLRDREVLCYLLCLGLGQVGLMAFVSNSSFVFVTYLGLEPIQYGFCFSVVMMGGMAGSMVNGRWVTRSGMPRMLSVGAGTVAAAGICAVILDILFGGIWSILLPSICYMFGMAIILANIVAQVLSRYRHIAGAASAVVGINQFLFGALSATVLSLNETPGAAPLAAALAIAGVGSAALWWGWLRSGVRRDGAARQDGRM